MSKNQLLSRCVLPQFPLTTTCHECNLLSSTELFFWLSKHLLQQLPQQMTPLPTRVLNVYPVTFPFGLYKKITYIDALRMANILYDEVDIWQQCLMSPCQIRYLFEQYALGKPSVFQEDGMITVFLVACRSGNSWAIRPLLVAHNEQYDGRNWSMWIDEGGIIAEAGQSFNCNIIL